MWVIILFRGRCEVNTLHLCASQISNHSHVLHTSVGVRQTTCSIKHTFSQINDRIFLSFYFHNKFHKTPYQVSVRSYSGNDKINNKNSNNNKIIRGKEIIFRMDCNFRILISRRSHMYKCMQKENQKKKC